MDSNNLKLFVLRTHKGGPVVPNLYFANKMLAKAERDRRGGDHVVSYGPDHNLYTGSK